uniref:Uncharacterized protein n=1 Tax=Rhizophora mucronata TaxID=61149 RepID=A0A2P2IVE1_RHIMU
MSWLQNSNGAVVIPKNWYLSFISVSLFRVIISQHKNVTMQLSSFNYYSASTDGSNNSLLSNPRDQYAWNYFT